MYSKTPHTSGPRARASPPRWGIPPPRWGIPKRFILVKTDTFEKKGLPSQNIVFCRFVYILCCFTTIVLIFLVFYTFFMFLLIFDEIV